MNRRFSLVFVVGFLSNRPRPTRTSKSNTKQWWTRELHVSCFCSRCKGFLTDPTNLFNLWTHFTELNLQGTTLYSCYCLWIELILYSYYCTSQTLQEFHFTSNSLNYEKFTQRYKPQNITCTILSFLWDRTYHNNIV